MKYTLLVLALSVAACSSTPRVPANTGLDLTGHFLGEDRDNLIFRPAVRLYLHPLADEPGAYSAVLLEYDDLTQMAPQFIANNKIPAANVLTGYLKKIAKKITAYKVVPTDKAGVYQMWSLLASGTGVQVNQALSPRQLILADGARADDPLEGARITPGGNDPSNVYFPGRGLIKVTGIQYKLANLVYQLAKLNSTWRKTFLPGPWLSAYARKDDVVLKLFNSGDQQKAHFVLNPAAARLSKREREREFTNGKSAFIEGAYTISEPVDGMFTFAPAASGQPGEEHINGRIGLFIDIFDATAQGNDVVELALIDPSNPNDFLMYYEDPANGEGQNYQVQE